MFFCCFFVFFLLFSLLKGTCAFFGIVFCVFLGGPLVRSTKIVFLFKKKQNQGGVFFCKKNFVSKVLF